jgi:hypothetical protein
MEERGPLWALSDIAQAATNVYQLLPEATFRTVGGTLI